MNVYFLVADCDHYQNLTLVNENRDWQTMYQFNGTPIGSAWQPFPVEVLYEEDASEQPPPSDFPSLSGGLPVFSRRAVEVLQPILQGSGELLPMECEDGDYFIFNVTRVVDALDETHSEIVRFPDGKKVIAIKNFVFIASQLEGVEIFKLPQQSLGPVFVTDRLVESVRRAGLVGFDFEWLWASEQRSLSTLFQSTKLQ